MKFSIIIPVYNVEKFLSRCMDCALNQSFHDYEVIAVNDGSTDSSMDILSKFQASYPRLKIITQKNKGLGGARNTGIKDSTGDYLIFLDSDDYIPLNMLEIINEYISTNHPDLLAFDHTMVDTSGHILSNSTISEFSDPYTALSQKQFLLLEPSACFKVYRRTLFTEYSISFPEKLWYEDLATIFKLVPHANRLGYLKESLYYYVQNDASITHSRNTTRMKEIKTAFASTLQYYRENHLFETYYDELEWNGILHVLYYSAYRFLGYFYCRNEMKEMYHYIDSTFPGWEHNKYLAKETGKRYLMDLIRDRQCLRFYLRTGFLVHYINPIIKHIKQIRGDTHED